MNHQDLINIVRKKRSRRQNEVHCFIQCTNLVAKSGPMAAEAPSHLFPAWAASGPDWHGCESEQLPVGLRMFVQQTDSNLHLQAPEETPPPSVNQIIKQSFTVHCYCPLVPFNALILLLISLLLVFSVHITSIACLSVFCCSGVFPYPIGGSKDRGCPMLYKL